MALEIDGPCPTLDWKDVEDAADEMFRVWAGGRELEWAQFAWEVLGEAGLTSFCNRLEKARVQVRLMVLATMYREFCWLCWDEKDEPMYSWWMDALSLDHFTLGQLVGPHFALDRDWDAEDEDALIEAAVVRMLQEERERLVPHLTAGMGGTASLFATLYLTNYTLATDDDHEDEEDEDADEDDCDDDDLVEDGRDDEAAVGHGAPDVETPHTPMGVENGEGDEVHASSIRRTLKDLIEDPDILDEVLNDDISPGKVLAYEWVRDGMPSEF